MSIAIILQVCNKECYILIFDVILKREFNNQGNIYI